MEHSSTGRFLHGAHHVLEKRRLPIQKRTRESLAEFRTFTVEFNTAPGAVDAGPETGGSVGATGCRTGPISTRETRNRRISSS